ncbi:MAG: glutamine--fructose-6-phosphate aminotransferase, partial [Planctomycetes bacterium]|nr:glutamine--fructose-6-phosphate aminotransferase [Planctomycetota bacterium]
MCGIVGYIGTRQAQRILLAGIKRLEYRGYDSAGIAMIEDGELVRTRVVGRVAALEEALSGNPSPATLGIVHTRWATHGRPSEPNAHPHADCSGRIAVVHNGI